MTTIITLLQARLSSTRLPGKVLKELQGYPMLIQQINRINQSQMHGTLIVVTSTNEEDKALLSCCKDYNIPCHTGSLNDVLDRFYQVATLYNPDHIVRLTGDCPLSDPEVIDHVINTHLSGNFDYTSNTVTPTYPDGLDVEVFRFSALERAWNEADSPYDREHVTPFIYRNNKEFHIGQAYNSTNLSKLRWTVDWPEDFTLIEKIYAHLFPIKPQFNLQDILDLLNKHPDLQKINKHYERNEGSHPL
jgi:spore coat polysaccharide biosynthesis protein SpsF